MELSKKALLVESSPTLAVDALAKKMIGEGIHVIGFGVGEPDFNTPIHIVDAAKEALDNGFTKYTPAAGIPELKKAVCDKLSKDNNILYNPSQIVVSNGAKHSLTNAFMAILNPGDEVILPVPYWVSYSEMIKISDGVPIFVEATEQNNFKISKEDLKKAITPKTKAIVINSPSNPTGMIYTANELADIAKIAVDNDLIIISDEIYEELIYDNNKHISIASFGEDVKERTIVVNGLSKAYAMTGWRMGYTASNSKIAELMANIQSQTTSNPNSIAQKAALKALTSSKDCIYKMRDQFEKRRNIMVEKINQIPSLSCIKPEGAFYVMMNVSGIIGKKYEEREIGNSMELSKILLEEAHVATIAGSSFGAEGFLRLSYAASIEDITMGIERIEQFSKKIK